MSYSSVLASTTRTKIDLIIIKLGFCSEVYGTSPCTAALETAPSGEKCYNTYPTCQDTSNFGATTRDYKFTNFDRPHAIQLARPYIKSIDDMPTEIQEKNTVVKRLKVTMTDEKDFDWVIDPYRSDRTSAPGHFWRKFLERNTNYKGKVIEYYEGFTDIAEGDYVLKFAGRLDNIKINNANEVTIEAVDFLKSMSDITYPFKTKAYITQVLPRILYAQNTTSMLNLDASQNDYCYIKTFDAVAVTTAQAVNAISGTLAPGDYKYYIVAVGTTGPIAISSEQTITVTSSENAVELEWTVNPDATGYRIYGYSGGSCNVYLVEASNYYLDLDYSFTDFGLLPAEASICYQLTGTDPRDSGDWTLFTTGFTCTAANSTELDSSGYLRIEKEIIYYSAISSGTLQGIERGKFETATDRHEINSAIEQFGEFTLDNPFTHLENLMTMAGIASGYIDTTQLNTLEAAWASVYFKLVPVFKDTKLSDLFFDLVNIINCICWVGEDGKITIKYQDTLPGSYSTLTDSANFIMGSLSADYNEKSRYTRWSLYYNRFDTTKDIKDKEGYNRTEVLVDSVAEGADYYNGISEDVQYTAWLYEDSAYNAVTVSDYLTHSTTGILYKRKARTNKAQKILTASVELKDDGIKVGDIVKVSTTKFQDIYGADYSEVKFRVVKKSKSGSKITLKLLEYI